MHILLIPSWYPKSSSDVSGVFFRDQAIALNDYGHKVGVIVPQLKSLRTLFDISKKQVAPYFKMDAGLPTYRKEILAALPRIPYGNYLLFKHAARILLVDYIRNHGKPEIIHAHSAIYAGTAAVELAKQFDIPVVLTEHSSGFARSVYSNWQLKLAEKAIVDSELLISVSPSLGEILGMQFPISTGNWKWIPNVVADRFTSPEAFAFEDRPLRFLNLALMTTNKGQFDLINAFQSVVKNSLRAELWLAGDGPIRTELEDLAISLGISEKVRFLGLIEPEKVPRLLSEVDVMVVSSHYETFGVVAAEALMAGVPVIATRCGGPECIVEQGDGLLVPPREPEQLSGAMQELGGNLQQYNRKHIAERAKIRFSGPAVAAQLTEQYKRILSDNVVTEQTT